jgi:hypothetical protein
VSFSPECGTGSMGDWMHDEGHAVPAHFQVLTSAIPLEGVRDAPYPGN